MGLEFRNMAYVFKLSACVRIVGSHDFVNDLGFCLYIIIVLDQRVRDSSELINIYGFNG